jgi:hypothetical protein
MAPDRFRMFLNAHMNDISVVHYLGVKPWMCTRACGLTSASAAVVLSDPLFQAITTACRTSNTTKVTLCTTCGGSILEKCAPQVSSLAEIPDMQ